MGQPGKGIERSAILWNARVLTRYSNAAKVWAPMHALSEGAIYGKILGFDGVWANADSQAACAAAGSHTEPARGNIGVDLLARIPRQAGISGDSWLDDVYRAGATGPPPPPVPPRL